jgi:predicted GH43/DUF377 family glycosyl hydrolase
MFRAAAIAISLTSALVLGQYEVRMVAHHKAPEVSLIDGTSTYSLVFNPTFIEPSPGTNNRRGLLIRTQNCPADVGGTCVFCGGSEEKASKLTFSEMKNDGTFTPVDESSIVFGPGDISDTWGTEDPRMVFNSADNLYYMFYTAYNGSSILLSLATSPNPTSANEWTRHGAVFPQYQNSKSGALLLFSPTENYLFWGDSSIRAAVSDSPSKWSDIGEIFLETRENHFDSKLVESGPPPIKLSNGNYLFIYNSATIGWPDDPNSAYHPGWVILDKQDPLHILQRSDLPLMTPEFSWELGVAPYTCNVPNVIFVEAAYLMNDRSTVKAVKVVEEGRQEGVKYLYQDYVQVFYGGADAVIGSAIIQIEYEDVSPPKGKDEGMEAMKL